jgi:hypothetical protein
MDVFRQIYMPYCLKRQPDGRYAVLNRHYKPVGFNTQDFVTYADYPVLSVVLGLTPKKAAALSIHGSDDVTEIFLYNDASVPTRSPDNMRRYLEKLAVLAKLKVSSEPGAT